MEILSCKGSVFILGQGLSAMLRVILPNFREEEHRSTVNFSVHNHCTPTLPIDQTKVIVMKNILEHQNDTNLVAVLKIQASEVGPTVQEYP